MTSAKISLDIILKVTKVKVKLSIFFAQNSLRRIFEKGEKIKCVKSRV